VRYSVPADPKQIVVPSADWTLPIVILTSSQRPVQISELNGTVPH
jgi:hypothetical protein